MLYSLQHFLQFLHPLLNLLLQLGQLSENLFRRTVRHFLMPLLTAAAGLAGYLAVEGSASRG